MNEFHNRPSNEEIAERAFQIYDREGRMEGRDLDNWLKAEAELMAERQGGSAQRTAAAAPTGGETDRQMGTKKNSNGKAAKGAKRGSAELRPA